MASPKTLALRAWMGALQPTVSWLDIARTPKTTLPGEFAAALREECRQHNIRRATERAGRLRRPGAIPTSGAARRRAKASRNKAAVLDMQAWKVTADGTGSRARGRQHEDDYLHADDCLGLVTA